MAKTVMESIFKGNDGFKTFDELTQKDLKKIQKLAKNFNIAKFVAFKDLSTFFKTDGVVFDMDYCYTSAWEIRLKGLTDIQHVEGNTYRYRYGNSGSSSIELPEITAQYLEKFITYVHDSAEKGMEAFNQQKYDDAVNYFKLPFYYENHHAIFYMAMCYDMGLGVERNVEKALELYEKEFPDNDPDLQTGEQLLEHGDKFFNKNIFLQALVCYKKADALNHPKASSYIGHLYQYGNGVDKDLNTAIAWYKRSLSLEPNDQFVNYKLALVYKELKQYNNMEYYLDRSKEGKKYIELGLLYYTGAGDDYYRDLDYAKELFERAARTSSRAYYYIAVVCKDKREFDEHFNALTKGDEAKDKRVYSLLGEAYEKGYGCEKDLEKAYQYYEKASEFYWEGVIALGRFYRDGLFVSEDDEKALSYFQDCINGKYYPACSELAKLYFKQGKDADALEVLRLGVSNKNGNSAVSLADYYIKEGLEDSSRILLSEALEFENDTKAKIAFMKYTIAHTFTHNIDDLTKYFQTLLLVDSSEPAYKNSFARFKAFYKQQVINEYIKKQEFEGNEGYFNDAIFFYNDSELFYFIDVKTLAVHHASPPLVTLNLLLELEDAEKDLTVGTKVICHYASSEITKIAPIFD